MFTLMFIFLLLHHPTTMIILWPMTTTMTIWIATPRHFLFISISIFEIIYDFDLCCVKDEELGGVLLGVAWSVTLMQQCNIASWAASDSHDPSRSLSLLIK